jgi:hypothetical protein
MDLLQIYSRALGMLGAERGLAILLALASVAIGRFDDLARGSGLFSRMVAEGGFTVPQEADS